MRVLLLGDANSSHIIKWVKSLAARDLEIALFSLAEIKHDHFKDLPNFSFKSLGLNQGIFKTGEGSLQKLNYLKALPLLKQFIKDFQADIVHAHYASSYGLLGRLSNFHPFIVSVWGSDIYDFPRKNIVFKKLIEGTLRQADQILSTSHVMAKETGKYTNKNIEVTPFGVHLDIFQPLSPQQAKKGIVLGTIKALEHKYGIDILIKAFAKVLKERKEDALSLEIIGKGTALENLQALCRTEGVEDKVHFLGTIDNLEVPNALNRLDIYLALSRWDSESFGVAIVEAQACETPVIVSNKGGLPEVVADGVTGIVVPSENVAETAKAIHRLLDDEALRKQMGIKGRQRVQELYDWQENVSQMVAVYTKVYAKKVEK